MYNFYKLKALTSKVLQKADEKFFESFASSIDSEFKSILAFYNNDFYDYLIEKMLSAIKLELNNQELPHNEFKVIVKDMYVECPHDLTMFIEASNTEVLINFKFRLDGTSAISFFMNDEVNGFFKEKICKADFTSEILTCRLL